MSYNIEEISERISEMEVHNSDMDTIFFIQEVVCSADDEEVKFHLLNEGDDPEFYCLNCHFESKHVRSSENHRVTNLDRSPTITMAEIIRFMNARTEEEEE